MTQGNSSPGGAGLCDGVRFGAFDAADLVVGLLVLIHVGAVARTGAARSRALCVRCCVCALFAALAVFMVGGVAGYMTQAAAPM